MTTPMTMVSSPSWNFDTVGHKNKQQGQNNHQNQANNNNAQNDNNTNTTTIVTKTVEQLIKPNRIKWDATSGGGTLAAKEQGLQQILDDTNQNIQTTIHTICGT